MDDAPTPTPAVPELDTFTLMDDLIGVIEMIVQHLDLTMTANQEVYMRRTLYWTELQKALAKLKARIAAKPEQDSIIPMGEEPS